MWFFEFVFEVLLCYLLGMCYYWGDWEVFVCQGDGVGYGIGQCQFVEVFGYGGLGIGCVGYGYGQGIVFGYVFQVGVGEFVGGN